METLVLKLKCSKTTSFNCTLLPDLTTVHWNFHLTTFKWKYYWNGNIAQQSKVSELLLWVKHFNTISCPCHISCHTHNNPPTPEWINLSDGCLLLYKKKLRSSSKLKLWYFGVVLAPFAEDEEQEEKNRITKHEMFQLEGKPHLISLNSKLCPPAPNNFSFWYIPLSCHVSRLATPTTC